MAKSYRDLLVWNKAMDLVVEVYRCTRSFPTDERFGLTAQLRRAAVSVPSNIAEGQGRLSTREFRHFLSNARASILEVETQLELASRLEFLSPSEAESIREAAAEVGRMLNGLLTAIRKRETDEVG